MKVVVRCPNCGRVCMEVLEKTMPINKDMLFYCLICKLIIPIRIFKDKNCKLWR